MNQISNRLQVPDHCNRGNVDIPITSDFGASVAPSLLPTAHAHEADSATSVGKRMSSSMTSRDHDDDDSHDDEDVAREGRSAKYFRRSDGRKYIEKGSLTEEELIAAKQEATAKVAHSEEEKMDQRRAANRLSAFQSRQRRKIIIEDLQRTVAQLSRDYANERKTSEALRQQLAKAQQQVDALQQQLGINSGAEASVAVKSEPGTADAPAPAALPQPSASSTEPSSSSAMTSMLQQGGGATSSAPSASMAPPTAPDTTNMHQLMGLASLFQGGGGFGGFMPQQQLLQQQQQQQQNQFSSGYQLGQLLALAGGGTAGGMGGLQLQPQQPQVPNHLTALALQAAAAQALQSNAAASTMANPSAGFGAPGGASNAELMQMLQLLQNRPQVQSPLATPNRSLASTATTPARTSPTGPGPAAASSP
jgi:hypothetical protein